MHKALCLLVLSGLGMPAVTAQEVATDSATVRRIAKAKKEVNYEMKNITGRIVDDATGEPMGGVRIQALGLESYSTLTEEDGSYKLDSPTVSDVIYVYAEGYNPLQVVVKEGKADGKLISTHFKNIYTDGTNITANRMIEVDETSGVSIDTDIQNHLAGDIYTINRNGVPGQGAYMQIRGVNSLNAGSQPMIILDGNIIDPQYDRTTLHEGFYNNLLASIDPEDIASVQVLKNGTALYGAKGANGVVIITTKRGKSQATKIGVRIYGGVELTPKKLDVLGGNDYSSYLSDMLSTMDDYNFNSLTSLAFLDKSPSNYYRNVFNNNTDWQKDMYQNAMTQNYKINVEGGDDVAMYNFSFGYTMSDSPLKGNNFNRLNIRLNSDIVLSDKLTTRFDIAYTRVGRELLDDGMREDETAFPVSSTGALAAIKSPFLSPYRYSVSGELSSILDLSDTFAFDVVRAAGVAYPNNSYYNPMTILTNGSDAQKNELEYTNLGITVAPELVLGDVKITETFNYSLHRVSEKYYLPYSTGSDNELYHFYVASLNGRIGNYIGSLFGKEAAISSDTRVDWSKVFGAHSLDVTGGFRYTNFNFDSNSIAGANSGSDNKFEVSTSLKHISSEGDRNVWTNMSWYLSADYAFKTRYFLQLAASMEASSRFGNKADGALKMCGVAWGFFPSVQAAWLMSSESWFNVKPVNMLKLRAGYDITGNDAIDYLAARSYLQAVKYYDKSMGLQLGNVENDGVKWESTARLNVGVDAMLFDNRLGVSLDWYKSTTSDLLVQKQYQYVTGMGTYWANGGELQNTGIEATVNAKLVNSKNWQWELGASVGHYKNEVTALDENIDPVSVYGGQVITKVGESIGSFYGYKTAGVISSSAEAEALGLFQRDATGAKQYFKAGDMHFVDVNPGSDPGCIDENDKVVIGNPNPDLYGNVFTRLSYKNLQLDVNCNYSLGNDVYNYYRQQLEGGSNFYNQTSEMLNRWTVDGQKTDIPVVAYGDPTGNSRFSDRWIEDGSYFRVKNVKLSYNVPVTADWLQGLTVWCAAENILTLTKYSGNDPEFSVNNNVLYQGVDAGLLPQTSSFHLGVKVNL